jgi:type VI secretion system secreted protein Hcp
MAFDAFIKFDKGSKIAGESSADGYADASDILSFSWGATNPTTVGSGSTGLTGGKVQLSSFNIMKKTDKASAALFQHCCDGKHIAQAVVELRKATGDGGGQKTFLKYTFHKLMVESIQWSGSGGGDDTPTESVSLAFSKVEIEYSAQDTLKGTLGVVGQASWDVAAVKK